MGINRSTGYSDEQFKSSSLNNTTQEELEGWPFDVVGQLKIG